MMQKIISRDNRRLLRTVLLLVGMVQFSGCDFNHGVEPIRTKITGAIIFDGIPPWYAREARVVLAKKFPPDNLLTDLVYSDPLPFNKDDTRTHPDTVRYELVAQAGVYPAVGVLWRRSGQPWDIANVIGLYVSQTELSPKSVVIDDATPIVSGVDVNVDWRLALRDAYLAGEISFRGEWPSDTEILALAVFPIVPKSSLDFLSVKALDINIPLFRAEPYKFRTAVASGTYKFITVFWKGKKTNIFDIRAIGFYACPTDSTLPKSVTVGADSTATGIDFVLDFSTLPTGAVYRKDGADCP